MRTYGVEYEIPPLRAIYFALVEASSGEEAEKKIQADKKIRIRVRSIKEQQCRDDVFE